jgi:hypothetical protein
MPRAQKLGYTADQRVKATAVPETYLARHSLSLTMARCAEDAQIILPVHGRAPSKSPPMLYDVARP